MSTGSPIKVPLIANKSAYNPNTLNYYSTLDAAGVEFLYVWSWYEESPSLDSLQFSYLALSRSHEEMLEGWAQRGLEQAENYLRDHREEFTLIYSAPLPDGTEVQVYRRDAAG